MIHRKARECCFVETVRAITKPRQSFSLSTVLAQKFEKLSATITYLCQSLDYLVIQNI